MTETAVRRPSQNAQGTYRAFRTVVLLTLHRRGEISDDVGSTARKLLSMAQLPCSVVPQGLSGAINRLRGENVLIADVDGSRTYSIKLAGRLSNETVEALKREEMWAHALITKQPRPPITGAPVEIVFAKDDEVIDPIVTDRLAEAVDLTKPSPPDAAHPSSDVVISMDNAVLMRIVAELSAENRSLRAQLGQPQKSSGLSSEVVEFISGLLVAQE